jgi:hypothetical protein
VTSYRDELAGLLARIDELEGQLEAAQEARARRDAMANLGPHAHGLFSRTMYHLGRAVGRLLRRRRRVPGGLDGARARARWLEERLAAIEAEQ